MQLICSDRECITDCLGRDWWGKMDFKGTGENCQGDGYIHYLNCSDDFMGGIHMSKYIKLYTLNMGSLLYVNFLNKVVKSF